MACNLAVILIMALLNVISSQETTHILSDSLAALQLIPFCQDAPPLTPYTLCHEISFLRKGLKDLTTDGTGNISGGQYAGVDLSSTLDTSVPA